MVVISIVREVSRGSRFAVHTLRSVKRGGGYTWWLAAICLSPALHIQQA